MQNKHGAMMCLDDDEIQNQNIKKKKKSLSIFTPYFQNNNNKFFSWNHSLNVLHF